MCKGNFIKLNAGANCEICKMNILITAATEKEIEPFLSTNHNAEIIITGIGIPSTIYHLTNVLTQNTYDLVIQAGIAGGFKNDNPPGQVLVVENDIFGDMGVSENGKLKTIFEMGLVDRNTFPFHDGWLENKNLPEAAAHLLKCNAVTVNTLSDNKEFINQLKNKFSAEIESMEGAAFHYVCLQQHVPFLQLRSISNVTGERDKTKWTINEGIANLNDELINLFTQLT